MAIETPGFLFTAPCAADLSSSQFYFGKINSSGNVAVVATSGVDHDGVIQNKPDTAGQAAQLCKTGITKVAVGTGGSTAGSRAAIGSNGKAVLATTEDSVGVFLDTVSSGEIGTVLLDDGPSRRSRTRRAYTDSTLTGAATLVATDNFYQRLDPGGANRNVTLPAVTSSVNLDFMIINSADAAENLVVKNAGGTTIGTINQNEAGLFNCDGSSWILLAVITIALT